jgi:methionine synthase I (cobalamin-dependent)/5,10-methylenetetrahydrofolate reductase
LNDECLLFDGAMGTYWAETRATTSSRCELNNLSCPSGILGIHREYVEAGAQAIKTNTFGANTALLGAPWAEVADVLAAGWRLAGEAASGRARVFADIGPIPGGEETDGEYAAIADAFISLGAERFLFETFAETESVLRAARRIKEKKPGAWILAQFAVAPDGFTRAGVSGAEIKRAMEASPDIDAWGFNCVSGPLYLYEYMAGLGPFKKPVSAMPNAGYPGLEGNRTVYTNSPDYFAQRLARFRDIGATILGGCCGTSPEHIRRAAVLLGARAVSVHTHGRVKPGRFPVRAAVNPFWEKLMRGEKAVAAEVDPPQEASAERMLDGARRLAGAGADIVTVSDNPLARARLDSSMAASLIQRRCGCAVLPHIACRDRNLNAIKSLLLGLHIEGVRNVLVVTGDPIALADRGEVKGVYNSNSGMLAAYIRSLNESVFSHDPFVVGAALNVNAPNFGQELRRAEEKAERGVRFLMTQPVFSDEALEALKKTRSVLGVKILAGLLPLSGHGNALFLSNEVPGMHIPDALVGRFGGLEKEAAEQLGVELAASMAAKAAPHCDGYYVVAPGNRIRMAAALIRRIRGI